MNIIISRHIPDKKRHKATDAFSYECGLCTNLCTILRRNFINKNSAPDMIFHII